MPANGKKRNASKKKEAVKSAPEHSSQDESPEAKPKDVNTLSSPKTKENMKEISSYFSKSPSLTKPTSNDSTALPESSTEESKTTESTIDSKQENVASTDHENKTSEDQLSGEQSEEKQPINSSDILSKKGSIIDEGDAKESGTEVKGNLPGHLLLSSPGPSPVAVKKKRKQRKKGADKETKPDDKPTQTAITEHFRVRRSQRKCKSTVEEEKRLKIEKAVLSGLEEGVEIRHVEGKGRGVFAVEAFSRGDFVCEYAGELIDYDTAKEREKVYSENSEVGCYMYYFFFKNKKYCVDATKETGRIGRLLNHSVNGNCTTKLISINDQPHLILVTAQDVKAREELLYDYGERSKDIMESHPWLKA